MSVHIYCKSVFNTVVEFRLEIKEIRGNTDPVLFSSFKISTENSLPFKLTLLTIDMKLGSVTGPVIQANGRLTFEDDLRSGGLLCFTTK